MGQYRGFGLGVVALGLTTLFPISAEAAGGKKIRLGCPDPCPTCPGGGYETAPGMEIAPTDPGQPGAEGAPAGEAPIQPVPADATDAAFDQALAGQYDVASASNIVAPNMIGDLFGGGSLTLTTNDFSGFPVRQSLVGPSPASGSGVGRIKFMENTNVLPQNRFFMGWEFFDSVPMTPGGTDVNRFTPGIEKTFFGGAASVEVRLPFAATLDSTQNEAALGSTNVEFGNMTFFFKSLLYSGETLAIGAGLTVTAPTASDLVTVNGDQPTMRMENEGAHLGPYLGIVYMPGRFFSQAYLQYDVDASGQTTYLQGTGSSLVEAGRLQDTSVLFTSFNMGYWIHRSNCANAFISGIAPLLEVHYSAGLGNGDLVTGPVSQVGDLNDSFNIVNMTLGTHIQIRQRTLLTVAFGLPLLDGLDRQFDYECKIILNHRFGRALPWYGRTPASF